MLILTRRTGEDIEIKLEDGRIIRITQLGVMGNQTRLGITAAKTITIDRAEIARRKRGEANGNVADPDFNPEREEQIEAAFRQREREACEATPTRRPTITYKPKQSPDSQDTRRKREGIA